MGEIPASVLEQLKLFHESLDLIESSLEPHFDVSYEEHQQRDALDQARIDLMSVYAVNGLYWMNLCTKGERPAENEAIMTELNRVKDYMNRLKMIQDRPLAPKINRQAAKSFVRNALWAPAEASTASKETTGDENGDNAPESQSAENPSIAEDVSDEGQQSEKRQTRSSAKRPAKAPAKATKRTRRRK
uniref:Nuclear nucleic acid-binding protein C1D n=1 Tax=Plectus sambesii TaxID=2011161 RepID=A0A914VI81_9BILA